MQNIDAEHEGGQLPGGQLPSPIQPQPHPIPCCHQPPTVALHYGRGIE
ncbi:MAG: hypothetical protein MUF72_09060 [Elainella sp. Prado103]|nr:hypothetical protein [Elainella sp. Prado103]